MRIKHVGHMGKHPSHTMPFIVLERRRFIFWWREHRYVRHGWYWFEQTKTGLEQMDLFTQTDLDEIWRREQRLKQQAEFEARKHHA